MLVIDSWPSSEGRIELFLYDKKNDTISSILYSLEVKPIYGKHNRLAKLLQRNEPIGKRPVIYPGGKIYFPPAWASELESRCKILPSGEVVGLKDTTDVPLPEREIAVEEKVLTQELRRTFESVTANIFFGYSQLKGTQKQNGTKGELNSSLNYGVELAWLQNWAHDFASRLSVNLARESYLQSDLYHISDADQWVSRIGLDLEKMFGELKFVGGYSVGEEVWYRATSTDTLTLFKVPMGIFKAGAEYQLGRQGPLGLSVGMSAFYLFTQFGNRYGIQSGLGRDAYLLVTSSSESWSRNCSVGYRSYQQTSDVIEYERRDLRMNCGIDWRL